MALRLAVVRWAELTGGVPNSNRHKPCAEGRNEAVGSAYAGFVSGTVRCVCVSRPRVRRCSVFACRSLSVARLQAGRHALPRIRKAKSGGPSRRLGLFRPDTITRFVRLRERKEPRSPRNRQIRGGRPTPRCATLRHARVALACGMAGHGGTAAAALAFASRIRANGRAGGARWGSLGHDRLPPSAAHHAAAHVGLPAHQAGLEASAGSLRFGHRSSVSLVSVPRPMARLVSV